MKPGREKMPTVPIFAADPYCALVVLALHKQDD